jgi:hypothetical protein
MCKDKKKKRPTLFCRSDRQCQRNNEHGGMKLVKRMEIYHKKVSDIIFITTVHGPPKMGSKMSV